MRFTLHEERPVDLAAAAAWALLLDLVVWLFPGSPLRVVLGLPLVLFLPGYVLVAALFPERHRAYTVERGPDAEDEEEVEEGLDALERVALSFGLSIAVVPLLGLALNYTPWGIRLVPILVTLTLFTLVLAAAAWWRRERLPPDERLVLDVEVATLPWAERSTLDRVLTVALAASVVVAAGTLAYVLLNPRPGEAFTEFYVLGPGGKASGYPRNLTVNQTGSVILGVRNHEHRTVDYVVEAWLVNQTGNGTNATVHHALFLHRWNATLPSLPVNVEPGKPYVPQWERPWNFTVHRTGTWKLTFVLYGAGLGEPVALQPHLVPHRDYAGNATAVARLGSAYRELHLWITVT